MIVLDINPISKPRQTQSDKWKQRPVVMRYRAYADELRSQVRGELDASLIVVFHIPMPKSWPAKNKLAMKGLPHQQKPDIDNLIKAFLDALCTDDSYIYDIKASKFWADKGRIEVTG